MDHILSDSNNAKTSNSIIFDISRSTSLNLETPNEYSLRDLSNSALKLSSGTPPFERYSSNCRSRICLRPLFYRVVNTVFTPSISSDLLIN